VNFVRPFLKLPLEVVSAVVDGDSDACSRAAPFIREDVVWSFDDISMWKDLHDRHVFVDATPNQIGIVVPGCAPVSVPLPQELPIYESEYLAALTAIVCMDREPLTLF